MSFYNDLILLWTWLWNEFIMLQDMPEVTLIVTLQTNQNYSKAYLSDFHFFLFVSREMAIVFLII